MDIDFKTLFSGIAVIVSIFSYDKARKSLKLSQKQHEENQRLNIRQALSIQYKEYIEIYNSEFEKHKQLTSELSTLINRTNSSIGDIFDFYDNGYRSEKNQGKHARHVYNEAHELIKKVFQDELSWQTPECIKDRLSYYRHLDLSSCETEDKGFHLHYDKSIKENIYTLNKAINPENKDKFTQDVLSKIYEFKQFYDKNKKTISSSILALENGLSKNKLEEFKLQENYELYRLYKQFLYLLKHIQKSSIIFLSNDQDTKYINIGDIIAYGADMSIINNLILNVSFLTYEK